MAKNTGAVASLREMFEPNKEMKVESNPPIPGSPNINNNNHKENRARNGSYKPLQRVNANANQCNVSKANAPAEVNTADKLPPKDLDMRSSRTPKKITEDFGSGSFEGFQIIDGYFGDKENSQNSTLSASEMDRRLVALDAAVELCNETKSDASEVLVQRGLVKFQQQKYEEALEDFNRALLSRPNHSTALQHRGMVKHKLRELEEALKDLNQADKLEPDNWLTLFMRGQVQTERGAFITAIDDFNRAELLQPNNKDIRKARAIPRLKISDEIGSLKDSDGDEPKPVGYWTSAVNIITSTIYQKSIASKEKRSKIVEKHHIEALSKFRQKNYQGAVDELTKAIELDKTNAMLLKERGEIYRRMKQFDDALKDLNEAEKLQPNDAITIASRALLYYERGMMKEAYSDFRLFDKLCPGNIEYAAKKLEVENLVLREIPHGEIINTADKQLGNGSFACVHKATWTEKNEIVARKLYNDTLTEEVILNEVKIVMECQHKNIVVSYGRSTGVDKKISLIMECSTDGSLQKMLSENPTLSPEQILGFARDIAAGLSYIHNRLIIHRDLKPANILLFNGRTTAKIADFGQSRALEALQQANTVTGTLGYMAPEMINEDSYEKPVDIYSFGVLLYELCPSNSTTTDDKLPSMIDEKARNQKINTVEAPYEAFRDLILRCCKTNPKERPTSQKIVQYLDNIKLTRVSLTDRVLQTMWHWSSKVNSAFWDDVFDAKVLLDSLLLKPSRKKKNRSVFASKPITNKLSAKFYSTNQSEANNGQIANNTTDKSDLRIKLLEGALRHVPKYGWSVEALSKAAKKIIFRQLHTALSLLAHPTELPTSLKTLAQLADEIAYQTGDDSTNLDWYAKRAAITGLYTSTELYMLTDTSGDFKATWEFVERRIEDLVWLSKAKSNLGTLFSTAASGAFSIINGLINSNSRGQGYDNNYNNYQGQHNENSSQSNSAVDQHKPTH